MSTGAGIIAASYIRNVSVGLRVASGEVASNLTDFVVRVDLNDINTAEWWDAVSPGGANIRVRNSVGTLLPRDLTRINLGTQTGELFFKSSLLTGSNNDFTLVAVSGAAAPAHGDADGRNAVWSDFDSVLIPSADFADGLSTLTDRTGGSRTVTIAGIAGGVVPTLTADGLTFGATASANVQIAGLSSHRTSWTLGVRARQNLNDNANEKVMIAYGVAGNNLSASYASLRARQQVNNNFSLWNSTDVHLARGAGLSVAAALNNWHRWTATHDGTTARTIRSDGTGTQTDAGIAIRPPSPGDALFLGNAPWNGSASWRGDLDLAYLRNGILSDNWLLAETVSWETPSSFYTLI